MDGKRQQLDVAHEIDPSDGTFRKLRDVLAEISGIPAIDIVAETSIFSLGLDSLSAIQIVQTGRKEGLNVSVADILQGRTVKGISQRICQKDKDASKADRDQSKTEPTTEASLISDTLTLEALRYAGVRVDDVDDVLPCLPGQSYHLATWLKSERTLGEAVFTYDCRSFMDSNRLLRA